MAPAEAMRAADLLDARELATLRDRSALADVIVRTERLLTPGGATAFSAGEPAVVTCARVIAKTYGVKLLPGTAPPGDEPAGEAIEKIARANGLLSRSVPLQGDWRGTQSAPLIAFRRENGTPVALLPKGRRWQVVDPAHAAKPYTLLASEIDAFDPTAYLLSPALPDRVLHGKDILAFGLARKWGDLAAFFGMTLIGGMLATLAPIATHVVTSQVVPARDIDMLVHVGAMLLTLLIAGGTVRLAAALATLRMEGSVGAMLKVAAADRAIRIMIADKSKIPSPATGTLVSRSVEGWHKGTWSQWLTVSGSVIMALPSLVVMTVTAPLAALIALVLLGGAVAFSVWVSRVQLGILFNGPSSPTSWISASYEALAGIETVRAFHAQDRLFTRFSNSLMDLKSRFLRSDRAGTSLKVLESVLEGLIVITGVATVIVLHRHLPSSSTAGFVMALMVVTGAATAMVHALTGAVMLGLQKKIIQIILDTPPAPAIAGVRPHVLNGAIRVTDVTFRHDPRGAPTLDAISLSIEPGEHIGIAGASGSGKSTLVELLLGLQKPESGQILYDGVDLAGLDTSAVRRQIGVVGQSLGLFPGTLFENIAAGCPTTAEKVWAALEQAAMADEIRAMPLGLSTPVSDADATLSRGQIQRIILARAFVQQPRLLILDEATSALDPAAEARVVDSFVALKATVITVAHRLDTLARCDRVYVLDHGRIVEAGHYSALVGNGGVFSAMVDAEARAESLQSKSLQTNPVHTQLEHLRQTLG